MLRIAVAVGVVQRFVRMVFLTWLAVKPGLLIKILAWNVGLVL
jgi:hypothetical protein